MNIDKIKNKKFGIWGLGRSGIAVANFFKKHSISFIAGDDEIKNLEFETANIDSSQWQLIDELVLSPGIALTHPQPHKIVEIARKHNIKIICDIELFCQIHHDCKFIAITGTNGKSTCASLTHHILLHHAKNSNCFLAGNIGIPVFSLTNLKKGDYVTLELSSFQLDLISEAHFDLAALLNITPDHLDRHGTFENYIESKKKIFKNLTPKDIAVIDTSSVICNKIYNELNNTKKIATSAKNCKIKTPNLPGTHNAQNIEMARAICTALGISNSEINSAILSFLPMEHRCELFLKLRNIQFVNDSKATNVASACKSIASFNNVNLIIGGVCKENDFSEILKVKKHINKAFIIGKSTEIFEDFFDKNHINYEVSANLEIASEQAFKNAASKKQEATILLAPAAASFDQFMNFEDRGKKFKEICQKIVNKCF